MTNYFNDDPIFNMEKFKLRYRMSRNILELIMTKLEKRNLYFTQLNNACGQLGLTPHQKMTSALRMLAYGESANRQDECVRIGDSILLPTNA